MWMLSERNFRGRLLANHKEKKLELHVEPDGTRMGKGREAKTLSGGEKSFSTICLLLSLWDAMGAPVRCLDELYVYHTPFLLTHMLTGVSDVFMDSVNREVSMRKMVRLLLQAAKKDLILTAAATDRSCPILRWEAVHPHHAGIDGQCTLRQRRQDHQVSRIPFKPSEAGSRANGRGRMKDPERGQTTISFPT